MVFVVLGLGQRQKKRLNNGMLRVKVDEAGFYGACSPTCLSENTTNFWRYFDAQ